MRRVSFISLILLVAAAGGCAVAGGVVPCARTIAGYATAARRSEWIERMRRMSVPPQRMKNWPDGWFDPWMVEWQFTHDRPNMRLLLFVVIWSLS